LTEAALFVDVTSEFYKSREKFPSEEKLMKSLLALVCAALCAATTPVSVYNSQERPVALVGARIIPISGAPIENGALLVARGKIVAVGARNNVNIPSDAEVRELAGKVIMPGLVDTHSHIGSVAGGDSSGPIQPETRVLDSIDVRAASLMRARAGGITTIYPAARRST
jgi:imidazolonepropionase-like amidohydrolase